LYLCLAGCEYRDIGFLVDASGSIVEDPTVQTFTLLKRFINRIIGRLDVGPNQNRVGVVQFSERVQTVFNFNRFANGSKADMLRAVDRMRSFGQNTHTALGLR